MKTHRWAYTLSILATLAVGILIGTLISSEVKGKEGQKGDASPLILPAAQPANNPLSQAFAQIAKQLEPSVVNINTESTIKNPHRRRGAPSQGPGDDDDSGGMRARLVEGHQLITVGPCAYIRNPIYTGMPGMLIATGLATEHWIALVPASVIFAIGMVIRIRTEEKLLQAQSGDEFEEYAKRVPAVVPGIY